VTAKERMDAKAKLIGLGLAGALAIIPVYEGTRLHSYKDPVGISTDCIGHTGKDVRAVNTLEQCYQKLYGDLATANAVVDSCVTVTLSSSERSAYASFAFNVGPGKRGVKDGFCRLKNGNEPMFLRSLNSGKRIQACAALMQWTKAGGVELPGLVKRRSAEVALCKQDLIK
jgi:lysozyme